jgi:hypothetical protein
MPLMKCTENGKSGWRWGSQGHCYTGPTGKKKAIKQGLAVEGPENFKKVMKSEGQYEEALQELSYAEQLALALLKDKE